MLPIRVLKMPLVLPLHNLPTSALELILCVLGDERKGPLILHVASCDCKCPWKDWFVYQGKDCNISSGKTRHARKRISRGTNA